MTEISEAGPRFVADLSAERGALAGAELFDRPRYRSRWEARQRLREATGHVFRLWEPPMACPTRRTGWWRAGRGGLLAAARRVADLLDDVGERAARHTGPAELPFALAGHVRKRLRGLAF